MSGVYRRGMKQLTEPFSRGRRYYSCKPLRRACFRDLGSRKKIVKSPLHWAGAVVLGLIALMLALPLIGAAFGLLMFLIKLAIGVAILVFVIGLIRRLMHA
jgi:hypothetical protein